MNIQFRREEARTWGVLLVLLLPWLAGAASLSLDQGPVVLGRTESVGVTLRVEEPSGTEGRPLRLSVNVGRFGPVTRVSPGVYRTQYWPPDTRFPQVALVAVWRETGPEAPIQFLRLPLYGTTRMEVEAPPGARVAAEVGMDSFGPVQTDRKGRAEVPLVVPPLVPEATIVVHGAGGELTRKRVAVAVPPYNRLTLALVPHALVANGRDWARVEVFYDVGREARPEAVRLVPSVGRAEFVRSEPGGKLVYRYVAPAGAREREVEFRAEVEGDTLASGSARLSLGLPPANVVQVLPPERPLVADGKSRLPVRVRVLDANGLGLPAQRLEVLAGGRAAQEVREEGAGEYVVELVGPSRYPAGGRLEVSASVERPDGQTVTGAAQLQVQPPRIPSAVEAKVSPGALVADGQSRATVTIDVRDAAGQPLSGVTLEASATEGAVSQVVEVGGGRYRAEFTAPGQVPAAGEAMVRLVDATGTHASAFPVPLLSPQRLLVGVRGGLYHGLGERSGPRAGLDVWAPFRAGEVPLAVGLSASWSQASQRVVDASRGLATDSEALLVPVTLRLGYGLVTTPGFGLYGGVGGMASWARVRTSASGREASGLGFGGLGFLAGVLRLGPGQLFAELSYGYAPLEQAEFRLEAGGAGVEVGYRVAVF
jgi:Invasin, domain 3